MFEREYMPTDMHAINVYAYVCIITYVKKKYLYVHLYTYRPRSSL